MIEKNLIGAKTCDVVINVKRDEIRRFCHVIDEENPIFHHKEVAKQAGYEDILIPPTYPVFFWQSITIPWLRNQTNIIQTEQTFSYETMLVANKIYTCHIKLESIRQRGDKQFVKHRLFMKDEENVVAMSETIFILF